MDQHTATEPSQKEVNDIIAVMEAELAVRDANSPERVSAEHAQTMGKHFVQHEVRTYNVPTSHGE